MTAPTIEYHDRDSGYSLVELMFVVVILTIGILALAKLFPVASREQLRDRMRTAGSYYAQQQMEQLRSAGVNDSDLADGRHPDSSTSEALGTSGAWHRYYVVQSLPDPLPNLKRVSVIVTWQTAAGPDSVVASTYLDR